MEEKRANQQVSKPPPVPTKISAVRKTQGAKDAYADYLVAGSDLLCLNPGFLGVPKKTCFKNETFGVRGFFDGFFFIFAIHQAYVRTKQIRTVFFHAWKGFKRGANQKCNTYLRRKGKHGVFFLANYNFDT